MIDPAYVHSVGQQVKADAQKLLGSEPEGVQDFQGHGYVWSAGELHSVPGNCSV
jgi:hypothetical protein